MTYHLIVAIQNINMSLYKHLQIIIMGVMSTCTVILFGLMNQLPPPVDYSYLKSAQSIEVFYIRLLPCPNRFIFLKDIGGCYCDPVLQNNNVIFVKFCNISDAMIQRPANSWIAAANISTYYYASANCPFDYCQPDTSYINLQYPDTHCQYNRSGFCVDIVQ